jgi:hypothetical protein
LLKKGERLAFLFFSGGVKMVPVRLYNRDRLPQRIVKFHDDLLKNSIRYFETERDFRKGLRKAVKSLKKASKLARKREINPGVSIKGAKEVLEGLREEIQMTRKALLVTSTSLGIALNKIQQERIDQPLSLIEDACESFRNKEIEKGLELLNQSRSEFGKKILVRTRTALFGGTSNAVKEMKEEIGTWMDKKTRAKE